MLQERTPGQILKTDPKSICCCWHLVRLFQRFGFFFGVCSSQMLQIWARPRSGDWLWSFSRTNLKLWRIRPKLGPKLLAFSDSGDETEICSTSRRRAIKTFQASEGNGRAMESHGEPCCKLRAKAYTFCMRAWQRMVASWLQTAWLTHTSTYTKMHRHICIYIICIDTHTQIHTHTCYTFPLPSSWSYRLSGFPYILPRCKGLWNSAPMTMHTIALYCPVPYPCHVQTSLVIRPSQYSPFFVLIGGTKEEEQRLKWLK